MFLAGVSSGEHLCGTNPLKCVQVDPRLSANMCSSGGPKSQSFNSVAEQDGATSGTDTVDAGHVVHQIERDLQHYGEAGDSVSR